MQLKRHDHLVLGQYSIRNEDFDHIESDSPKVGLTIG